MLALILTSLVTIVPFAAGHSAFFHPSMYGFNVTDQTFPFDNRPVAPLRDRTFTDWWFHGHLDFPPNEGDFFDLPAGQPATAEIACNKGATSYFASSEGGDIRNPSNPNDVCPGASSSEAYHTIGLETLTGCALAIAYNSDARAVKPEDFTVFSVNHTCVWTRFTDFQVPANMPPCPEGGCTCAFFWIHSPKSGGEENYMNGFKCNVTGSTSTAPLATPKLPRRCGADSENNRLQSAPGNCTYGAKQPYYWFNKEGNNMFEGAFSPPVYNDLYNFLDGAQEDIFENSYSFMPDPAPNAALPILATASEPGDSSPSSDSPSPDTTATATSSSETSTATAETPSDTTPDQKQKSPTCKRKQPSSSAELASRSLTTSRGALRNSIFAMTKRSRKLQPGKRASLWHMF
ncbi:hypothetical protein Hypma_001176 [Hypsizygus marmoreus]|uniref:Uncharacterized protein n=1 Tax=Hypsizygus marmoreus TaxID=39966 RepID=A0A369J6L7_HYPMA|nr:hypothetical protein Hypma_001176 [Hypsizygus marmoreus]